MVFSPYYQDIIENNILQIDLLKIDTEGDELSVLMGFEDMIK